MKEKCENLETPRTFDFNFRKFTGFNHQHHLTMHGALPKSMLVWSLNRFYAVVFNNSSFQSLHRRHAISKLPTILHVQ